MAFLKLRQFSSNLSYAETATDSGGLFTPFKIIDLKSRYIVPLHTPLHASVSPEWPAALKVYHASLLRLVSGDRSEGPQSIMRSSGPYDVLLILTYRSPL